MGLEADAGTILKIAGDAGGCDDNSDASEDGSMGLEADSGAVSEFEGGVDGSGEAAAPAAAIRPALAEMQFWWGRTK